MKRIFSVTGIKSSWLGNFLITDELIVFISAKYVITMISMKMYSDNNNEFVGFFDHPFWQAPKLGGIICKTNLIASAVVTTIITKRIVIITIILIEIIITENLRTVESTYWYAIATLCDWFKNLGSVFQSIRSKI